MVFVFDHLIDSGTFSTVSIHNIGYQLPTLTKDASLYIYLNQFSINKYISICCHRLWENIEKQDRVC